MTLDTRVMLKKSVAPDAVRTFVNTELLSAPDAREDSGYWSTAHADRVYAANAVGQGFDAWFMAYAMKDGSPVRAIEHGTHGLTGKETERTVAKGAVMLSFDTGYGYMVEGAGCGDLHAYFIVRLAQEFGNLWFELESWGEWHYFRGADSEPLLRLGDPAKGEVAVAATRKLKKFERVTAEFNAATENRTAF